MAKTTMTQVLFVQGGGAGAHAYDRKLAESLAKELGPRYAVRYPRMPNEQDPRYDTWRATLTRELAACRDGDILVGHSVGGTVLVHALAEQTSPRAWGAIVLIAAPFVGPGGWSSDDLPPRDLHLPRGVPILLYHGTDDEIVPVSNLDLYANALPAAHMRRLAGRDHQFNNDLSDVAADLRRLAHP